MSNTPDWATWCHVSSWTRLECVAISLNQEPGQPDDATAPEFRRRIKLLCRAESQHLKIKSLTIDQPEKWRLEPAGFATWALQVWGRGSDGIPDQLADMATPQPSVAELQGIIADQKARIESLQAENTRLLADLESSMKKRGTVRTDHAIIGGLMHILTNGTRKKPKNAVIDQLAALGKLGLSKSNLDKHEALRKENFNPADIPDSEGIAAALNKSEKPEE